MNKIMPYGRQWLNKEDIRAVASSLRSDFITQGPKAKEFEKALCEYTGARYAVAVSSGTAALHIACLAAGIVQGDEVITTPITFAASANCALYCGAKPVFADIDVSTVNIDPAEIEKKITKKTRAIIPVHFTGHPCDLAGIAKIAKDNKLILIEDAAHALGASYKGEKIGSCRFSEMAVFSFHPVKSITTGEGGAVLTNSKVYFERFLRLRTHGVEKDPRKLKHKSPGSWYYEMQELGFNYRITDFQCALGIAQLAKADKFIARRRRIAVLYHKAFSEIDEIILPVEEPLASSAWHLYVIRLRDSAKRNKAFEKLRESGIGAQVHYIPVYKHPYYKRLGYAGDLCPNAEEYYRSAISLPLYPKMTVADIDKVIKITKKVIRSVSR